MGLFAKTDSKLLVRLHPHAVHVIPALGGLQILVEVVAQVLPHLLAHLFGPAAHRLWVVHIAYLVRVGQVVHQVVLTAPPRESSHALGSLVVAAVRADVGVGGGGHPDQDREPLVTVVAGVFVQWHGCIIAQAQASRRDLVPGRLVLGPDRERHCAIRGRGRDGGDTPASPIERIDMRRPVCLQRHRRGDAFGHRRPMPPLVADAVAGGVPDHALVLDLADQRQQPALVRSSS